MFANHKGFWPKDRVRSLSSGLFLLIIALTIQGFASHYVNHLIGTPVEDLILSRLPTLDIDFVVIQGALLLTLVGLALIIAKPRYIIFSIKAFALFIITRSFLLSLTHLGADPHRLIFDQDSLGFGIYNTIFNTNNDVFFSGHTGTPFLLALIFWDEKQWRYLFLATTVLMGVGVLVTHMHYSIDVFAAPFITYSIYALTRKLFPADYKLSKET